GTPVFWILYVMFVLVAASGLVVTAQVAPIARDYKIANLPVGFLFISSTVLVMAGIVDNVLNGLARPTFGWVSDHIGRENTMALVFTAGAGAYWALGTIGTTPWAFIITAGLVYFTWGEIYSLFPALCTDVYGSKYAATNAGLLYTAKGAASFLVPVASLLQASTGSWHAVFTVAAIANVAVSVTALLVVKPLRTAAQRAAQRAQPAAVGVPVAAKYPRLRMPLDVNALAQELASAYANRQAVQVVPSARETGLALSDAYAVEAELARLRRVDGHYAVGRKVGYANKAMWRVLKLETLVWA